MSEISDIRDMVCKLNSTMEAHIADTVRYRIERDKVINAVTDSVWDKDGRPGAFTKIDRLEISEKDRMEKEKNRIKLLWGTVSGMVLMLADKFFHFFPK